MVLMMALVLIGPLGGVGGQGQDQAARSRAEAKFDALVEALKAVSASNPALRQELLKMGEEDQRLRAEGQKTGRRQTARRAAALGRDA